MYVVTSVATAVCPHTPRKKLLILKKREQTAGVRNHAARISRSYDYIIKDACQSYRILHGSEEKQKRYPVLVKKISSSGQKARPAAALEPDLCAGSKS